MNSERNEPAKRSVIPPLHPDTIAAERHLAEFALNQSTTLLDLARIARADVSSPQALQRFSNHVGSACRRLRNGHRMVFARRAGVIKRLDDEGIKDAVADSVARIGRASRRVIRTAACADFDALSDTSRVQLASSILAAKGAEKFSSARSANTLRRLASNSRERIPELDDAWRQLRLQQ